MDPLNAQPWFLILAAPFVGSFLGLLVIRLPTGTGIALGRSACTHCGEVLWLRDLVPFLSWLIARGRCRHCNKSIGALYPLVELGALLIALWSTAILPGWLAYYGCILGWALLTLAVIDARDYLLPDRLVLPLIPAGLMVVWLVDPARLLDHVLGAVGGFLAFFLLLYGFRRIRGYDGLGLGDAKFMAVAGAWVSWEGLPSVVLYAAVGALIVALGQALTGGKRLARDREIAFGPYLAGGLWLVWLYGPLKLG